MKLILIAMCLVASLLSGCVYTSFEAPNGVKLTRIGFGTGTNIAELQIPVAGGMAKMRGYSSEQAEVAAAMIDAAFRAGAASAGLPTAQAPATPFDVKTSTQLTSRDTVQGDTPARAPDR